MRKEKGETLVGGVKEGVPIRGEVEVETKKVPEIYRFSSFDVL